MTNLVMTTELEERSRVRITNDLTELDAFVQASGGRVRVDYDRFGTRFVTIRVFYPQVPVPFIDQAGSISVERVPVRAVIDLSGKEFPYPFGAPQVRLTFPTTTHLAPYIGGLYWADGSDIDRNILSLMIQLEGALTGALEGVGVPCLYRHWQWDYTLRWLVIQIHRLLTLDRSTQASPNDALNSSAARYWANQTQFALPLESGLDASIPPRPSVPRLRLRRADP